MNYAAELNRDGHFVYKASGYTNMVRTQVHQFPDDIAFHIDSVNMDNSFLWGGLKIAKWTGKQSFRKYCDVKYTFVEKDEEKSMDGIILVRFGFG